MQLRQFCHTALRQGHQALSHLGPVAFDWHTQMLLSGEHRHFPYQCVFYALPYWSWIIFCTHLFKALSLDLTCSWRLSLIGMKEILFPSRDMSLEWPELNTNQRDLWTFCYVRNKFLCTKGFIIGTVFFQIGHFAKPCYNSGFQKGTQIPMLKRAFSGYSRC